MESVVFTSKKKSDLKLLVELAKKIGIKSQPLSKQEIEDWALAKEIDKGLKSSFVSRASVMKALLKK
jgi:predicted nucleotidyltransferase